MYDFSEHNDTMLISIVVLVKALLWEGVLVHGCDWGWGLGFRPSLPSKSKYVLIFLIKGG